MNQNRMNPRNSRMPGQRGSNKNPSKKTIPIGVKIISIWYIISAFIILFLAIILTGLLKAMVGGIFGEIAGIIAILFAILSLVIGIGLWKGKNWARIVAIIFAGIGFFSTLGGVITGATSFLGSLISLIISGTIAGYLTFSKEIKEAFKKEKPIPKSRAPSPSYR